MITGASSGAASIDVLARAVEKAAAVDGAVDIGVEQDEQLRVEIFGSLLIHLHTS